MSMFSLLSIIIWIFTLIYLMRKRLSEILLRMKHKEPSLRKMGKSLAQQKVSKEPLIKRERILITKEEKRRHKERINTKKAAEIKMEKEDIINIDPVVLYTGPIETSEEEMDVESIQRTAELVCKPTLTDAEVEELEKEMPKYKDTQFEETYRNSLLEMKGPESQIARLIEAIDGRKERQPQSSETHNKLLNLMN